MRSLAVSSYTTPDHYEVMDLPKPSIASPEEVLIKVHAASINPVDVKLAGGLAKLVQSASFPYKIGLDLSGEICEVGTAVTRFKVGDEVFGCLRNPNRGSVAEYAVTNQDTIALKPSTLTHVEAASLTIAAVTAIQAIDRAIVLKGSLEGKTVLIPAALSGTGSFGLQLAKNVYGAAKVITTASTQKIPKIPELLGPGLVDQIVDYKSQDPLKEIPRQTVDLVFDTLGTPFNFISLLKPKTGVVISIAGIPSGAAISQQLPELPFYLRYLVELGYRFFKWRAGRWSVAYDCIMMDITPEDLDRLRSWIDEGKVRPVVGKIVRLDDLEAVREGCNEVYKSHGGIGKTVIQI